MSRHGLWQFHRSLHERGPHLKWWTFEEVDQALSRFNMVSGQWLGGAFVQSPYRKMDVVIRCANRFIRRYGISRNVKNWNEVCERIGSRMNAHRNTMKAVLHSPLNARTYTPLSNEYKGEFDHPNPVRSRWEVQSRLDGFVKRKEDRQKREKNLCCICQKKDGDIGNYLWSEERKLLGLEDVLENRPSYKCCFPCYMGISKLLKKAKMADEARLSIQRFKRKQNESTKNNARTA